MKKQLDSVKTIAILDKELLKQCRDAIKAIDAAAEVILYGSRARGDALPESDYDLLILTDGEVTLNREDIFRRAIFPIELETGAVLTVILISKADWDSSLYEEMPLYKNIRKDGIRL